MKLNWIEDILAIADTGSLSKAAERRNLTQPAFSRRIQAIEDVLGVELLDRTKKPAQLLSGVMAHRDQFARLDTDLHQLIADLRYGSQVGQNQISIASQHSLTTVFTPRLIQRLQHGTDHLTVRLASENLDECIGSLLASRTDIALIYRHLGDQDPVIRAGYIRSRFVGSDWLIPVCGVDAIDLLGHGERLPVVSYPSNVYLGRIFNRVILPRLRNTYTLDSRVQTSLTLAALELAENGSGIAWIPRSLGEAKIRNGVVADLSDRLPACELDIVALRLVDNTRTALARAWYELGRIAPAGQDPRSYSSADVDSQ